MKAREGHKQNTDTVFIIEYKCDCPHVWSVVRHLLLVCAWRLNKYLVKYILRRSYLSIIYVNRLSLAAVSDCLQLDLSISYFFPLIYHYMSSPKFLLFFFRYKYYIQLIIYEPWWNIYDVFCNICKKVKTQVLVYQVLLTFVHFLHNKEAGY